MAQQTKLLRRMILVVVLAICLQAGYACADNAGAELLGKWVENFPNGKKILVEFTDTTISFTPVDQEGKAIKPPNTADVMFRKLEKSDKGETISIDFKDKDGKASGGILAVIKSQDEMILDFPGAGAAFFTREK